MQLAAVGVSIAIFNQASRITIFPLVSITTSFVAEEETIGRITNGEEPKAENSEKSSAKESEMKDVTPEETVLENLEKGASTDTTTTETKGESSSDNNSSATTCKSPSAIVGTKTSTEIKLSKGKRHIPSASTALIIGSFLGLVQAIFLILGARPLLHIMGVKSVSS